MIRTSQRALALIVALWSSILLSTASVNAEDLATLEARARNGGSIEARIQALEAIAALQIEGESPREPVTKSLAIGLKDDAIEVRRRTVALLGPAQHPEVSVRELAKAANVELRLWKKAGKDVLGFRNSREGAKLSREYDRAAKQGPAAAEHAEAKYNKQVGVLQDVLKSHGELLDEMSKQLAKWSDSRSVSILATMLKECTSGKLAQTDGWRETTVRCLPIIDSLLALGSRKALDATMTSLKGWNDSLDEAKRDLKKVRSKSDEYYEWVLDNAEVKVIRLSEHTDAIRKRLRDFAKAKGLPMPPGNAASSNAWRSWSTKVRGKLPKALGSISETSEE